MPIPPKPLPPKASKSTFDLIKSGERNVRVITKAAMDELVPLLEEHFKDKFADSEQNFAPLRPATVRYRQQGKKGYYKLHAPESESYRGKAPIYQWTGSIRKSLTESGHPDAIRRKKVNEGILEFGTKTPHALKIPYKKRGDDLIGYDDAVWAADKLLHLIESTDILFKGVRLY